MKKKLFFIGGESSKFISKLQTYLTNDEFDTQIINVKSIIEYDHNLLNCFNKNSIFIISFANKSNDPAKVLKSFICLKKMVLLLKQKKVSSRNIIIFGSESYIGPYNEIVSPTIRVNLMRDIYAFDSLVRLKVLSNIFKEVKILFLPGTNKKIGIIRYIILFVLSFILGLKTKTNINKISIEDVSQLIHNIVQGNYNIYETKLSKKDKVIIKGEWILKHIPIPLIKYVASTISFNFNNANYQYIKLNNNKRKSIDEVKVPFVIFTYINEINDDFLLTFHNIITLSLHINFEWTLCISKNIESELVKLCKNSNFIKLITGNFSSWKDAHNLFLKDKIKENIYYVPLIPGDILFSEGLREGLKKCYETKALFIFCPHLKNGKLVYKSKQNLKYMFKNDKDFLNGNSASVFINVKAHKYFDVYNFLSSRETFNTISKSVINKNLKLMQFSSSTLGYNHPYENHFSETNN